VDDDVLDAEADTDTFPDDDADADVLDGATLSAEARRKAKPGKDAPKHAGAVMPAGAKPVSKQPLKPIVKKKSGGTDDDDLG
jgi:hypothetical protein